MREYSDAFNEPIGSELLPGNDTAAVDRWDEVLGEPGGESSPAAGDDERKVEKKSAATLLVEMAERAFTFGISELDEPFAVPVTGPELVRTLRGGKTSLRAVLARMYFDTYRKAAPQQALADALLVLEGKASGADSTPLHLRVAEHDGALWLDLGDATGRAVRISEAGWTIADNVPVRFKRTSLQLPLPEPRPGGSLDLLRARLNIDDKDWPLILAYLVACLMPSIPHPVLSLVAEQGTGKSTATKVMVSVLDPSPVPLRKPPKDMDSWVTAAQGSWIVGLDNLSSLPEWLSDSLCRAVTGDGDVRRKLYTDGDFAVFAFRRCIIANGIDLGGIRDDLADRMLPITLHVIDPAERTPESELWPHWADEHPFILGALLDLTAGVAGIIPSVSLGSAPRMADFARVIAAVDRILGTTGLHRYTSRSADLAADQLSGELFYLQLHASIGPAGWEGNAAELLAMATPTDPTWRAPRSGWPKNARAVTGQLRRMAPTMRKVGWRVEELGRGGHANVSQFGLTPPTDAGNNTGDDHQEKLPESLPQRQQRQQDRPDAGDAGDAGTIPAISLGLSMPVARQPASSVCSPAAPVSGTTGCEYCGQPATDPDGFCDAADDNHVQARRMLGRPRPGGAA